MNLIDKAKDFLAQCASGNIKSAYEHYVAKDFKHHNPYFNGDAQSLLKGMEENALKNPDKIIEFMRCALNDNCVFVHSKIQMGKAGAVISVVHIFRFEADLIVELWDIGQMVPDAMQNQFGMF
ncbi:MAG: nuclear transport factor 2 family protein [Moraxellaceae bacterium]|nr:MAG: nuclear transport factor 2 family protein [Moraxellaceae bacterium]